MKQIKKALELYEQLRQRTGVVVVGPSGSGKSTLWRILRLGLQKINKVVKHYTMNPKAMPRTQLLGHIDMDTREWTDGVLTYSARQVVKEPQGEIDFYASEFQLFTIVQTNFIWFNPFPNNPRFLRVCCTSLLKTLREKEKLLVTSNFSFSRSVFYPFGELSAIFIKLEIVICNFFQFGRV